MQFQGKKISTSPIAKICPMKIEIHLSLSQLETQRNICIFKKNQEFALNLIGLNVSKFELNTVCT